MKDSAWEIAAQRRTITRSCALFIAWTGEGSWKAIRDRLRSAYCL